MRFPEEYVNLADYEAEQAEALYQRIENPPTGTPYNTDVWRAEAQYHATLAATYGTLAQVALGLRTEPTILGRR